MSNPDDADRHFMPITAVFVAMVPLFWISQNDSFPYWLNVTAALMVLVLFTVELVVIFRLLRSLRR